MSASKQSAGRRLGVITIDQVISGGSNVLMAVLAARLLPVASFGLFGIVFLVYTMMIGVSRALVSDPVLVHPVEAQERPGEMIGTSLVLGVVLGLVLVLVGYGASLLDTRLGDALIVLGGCFPLLVLQDLGRYLGFATQRPVRSVLLDAAWLVLMVGAVAALFATGTRTLPWFIAAWAGSGAAAGVLLFSQYRARDVRPGLTWLRYTWPFSWRYLISYTSTQGAALGASSGVGALAGARALGGVQGAVLLVRPFTTFQVAAIAAAIGEITRSPAGDRREFARHVARTSGLTTGVALVNVLMLLVLPDRLGEVVLGASWHAAKPLLLATGVQIILLGLVTGVRAGLLGRRAIRKVMVRDVATTVLVLAATLPGALINGAKGALWAIALAQGLMAVVWWITFFGEARRAKPTAAGVVASEEPAGTGRRSRLPAATVAHTPHA